MATLKVVGFKDRKIGALLIGQNLWISLIGVIIGIPLGAAVLDYLMHVLASEYEMKTVINISTYLVSILLTVGMSFFVSLIFSNFSVLDIVTNSIYACFYTDRTVD